MNILIPCAGAGSRFKAAGYELPKPLIDVDGTAMIGRVVDNLDFPGATHIFITQKAHWEQYKDRLSYAVDSALVRTFVLVDGLTDGAARTTLLAEQFIDNDEPLLIANSDQLVLDWDSSEFLEHVDLVYPKCDACIVTFKATDPKWSFARFSVDRIVEVAEKNPISDTATVGIYWWRRGSDYVKYAKQMIAKNIRTNGELYVCPVFNEAILDEKHVIAFQVKKMQGLGTPEDLQIYLYPPNQS